MTAFTEWARWLGLALSSATVAGLVWILFADDRALGRTFLASYQRDLDKKLRFIRAPIGARAVLLGQGVVLALLVAVAGVTSDSWLLLLGPLVVVAPRVHVERLMARRATQVEAQIEPWLNAVANSLRASPSLGEAIASSASLVAAPMAQEVDVLVKEYELGTPLDRALDNLSERVPSKTLAGTTLALKVARRSGGNLPQMLDSAAVALRELARLEGVVRTKTAEGKAQAAVIGAIPLPLVALVHYSDPHFFAPLASSFTGNIVVGVACALWVVAALMARKILQVDV
jgi:tight adherence protein B